MEKNKIFFGEGGISTTQANTIANWAKELYQNIDTVLENIKFYNEAIKLLDSSAQPYVLEYGVENVEQYNNLLKEKAELQSLIAWLREAIKAKEDITKSVKSLTIEDIANQLEIELPEAPTHSKTLTEDEYIGNLSIKERNRYYKLETLCAVYGKFIHPAGAYSTARKNLSKILQKPNVVSGSGKDTTIKTSTPTISLNTVDAKFFELQQKHREYEAELNGMKHKMELAIQESEDAANTKYEQEMSTYLKIKEQIDLKCYSYKEQQLVAARDLKIIIPNDLQSIFKKVSLSGKS